MADNFDFGNFFSDFLSKEGKNYKEWTPPYTSSQTETTETVFDDEDWKNKYDILLEDFKSYKNRVERQKSIEKELLMKELVLGFLDVVDYAIQIYKAKRVLNSMTEEDNMFLAKLTSFLDNYGVVPMVNIVGKPFDHRMHNAIAVVKDPSMVSGTIAEVLTNGFMIGDKVLRHAKVSVYE